MSEQTKEFWSLYDQYIQNGDKALRHQLSKFLMVLENKDRRTQILRPEKNWNNIIAWQVLRTQQFIFSDTQVLYLYEGEVIGWSPHWDRDIFLTRVPIYELVSGRYIKPGFKLTHEDKGDTPDHEWRQTILHYGLTNECGLYLPIFDADTLMKLCDREISLIRPTIKETILRNLAVSDSAVKDL